MTAGEAPDRLTVWAIALTAPTFIYATNYLTSTYGRIDSMNTMLAELGVELAWVTKAALAIGDNGLLAIFAVTTIAQAVVMFTRTPSKVKLVSAIAYFVITAAMANLMLRGVMQPMVDIQRALAG